MLKKRISFWAMRFTAMCFAAFFLASCSAGAAGGTEFELNGSPRLAQPEYVRPEEPLRLPDLSLEGQPVHEDNGRTGIIDTRNVANGYVVASATSMVESWFEVKCGDQISRYRFDTDGTPQVFPLVYGNGLYTFTIFLQMEGNNYEYFYVVESQVQLVDEFAPFLVPNQIVDYDANSATVAFARQLTAHCTSKLEIAQQVYYWVQQNITYDVDKANYVVHVGDYRPDVDQVLRDQKGICYDYAALTAAMLRSNDIPCKLIKGYVKNGDKDVYHAWNMLWLEETGWIAVEFPTNPKNWERIDLTFAAAGGADMAQFIGDGQNYTDTSVH